MNKIIIFLLLLLSSANAGAQTYEHGIQLMKENKLLEAYTELKSVQKSGTEAMEASLALAIVDANLERYLEGFNDFKVFFDKHPNPYPYFYALYNSGIFSRPECRNNENVVRFLTGLLNDKKANATIKAEAMALLGSGLEYRNEYREARSMYGMMADIKNWSSVGPFDNVSGSGFNKDYGALAHPESSYEFVNPTRTNVKWMELREIRNDRWQDLTYHMPTANSIIYSQSFVKMDAAKDALLMVGVSGSLKVWVNDFLVGAESDERNTDADVFTYQIKLQQGYNRILVQTGRSEIDRDNFLVRIADLNGNPIPDLESLALSEPYQKAKPYEVKQIPFAQDQYFEKEAANNPADFITNLLLFDEYEHNMNVNGCYKTLATLKKGAPGCTLVSQREIALAYTDDNPVAAGREKEAIMANDPESPYGFGLRISELNKKAKYDEIIDLVNKKTARYGESANSYDALIYALIGKKDNERAASTIKQAYEKYPDDHVLAEYKYYWDIGTAAELSRNRREINNYLKHHFNHALLGDLIEKEYRNGNREAVADLYKKEIEADPINGNTYLKLAELLVEMNKYNEAFKYLEIALEIYPAWTTANFEAARLHKLLGENTLAAMQLKKTLNLAPLYQAARKELAAIENQKDVFASFKQNDADKLYAAARKNDKYKDDDAVVILDDKKIVIYPERNANEQQCEFLIMANSQAALGGLKDYSIPYNYAFEYLQVEKAELLKPDGSKVPAERDRNYMVFSSIAVGDAIHVIYRIQDGYTGELSGQFWNQMTFNSVYPVECARFSILAPKANKYNYFLTDKTLKPEEQIIGDNKLLTWEAKDLPKVTAEPLMTDDMMNEIVVSSFPDWNYIADWYSDVSFTKTKADYVVKEKVRELMAGNENKTAYEKARIIYNYIEDNITYSSVAFLQSALVPQKASRTLVAKLGDCKDLASLFVAMTREAGLKSNLILVRTKGSGGDLMPLPSISFNHCIAQLHIGDSSFIVELTNNHLPFASVSTGDHNANGLFIPADGGSTNSAQLVKLNSNYGPQATAIRNSKMSFSGNSANIHRDVVKTGMETAPLRYAYRDKSDKEVEKSLTEIEGKEFGKNVAVHNIQMKNMKTLADTIFFNYDVAVENFCHEIAGLTVCSIPWTEKSNGESPLSVGTVFALEKRKYPMDFEFFREMPEAREQITIAFPAGKKLVEVPKNVTLTGSAISFSIRYEVKADKIIATREVTYLKDLVQPDEYESVKKMVAQIGQADATELAFK